GNFDEMKQLYKRSLFVRTLFDNCEMSMEKSFFPLTAHLRDDKDSGALWQMIFDEYELTKKYVLKLSGADNLMETYPVDRQSISMREKIVLPLSTIQQYALGQMNHTNDETKEGFKKLVVRCSFGIINAARNSV
ncbi:MAG: phosphoenolpyruvate carboxylase, partial [Ginsengibacter sp.]